MESKPITWETINDVACAACNIRPASRQVLLRIKEGIELQPLLCEECSEQEEGDIKKRIL